MQGGIQPTRGNFEWMSHQFTPRHLLSLENVLNITLGTLGGVRHRKDFGGARCFSRCRRSPLVPILNRNCFASLSGSVVSTCTCGHAHNTIQSGNARGYLSLLTDNLIIHIVSLTNVLLLGQGVKW